MVCLGNICRSPLAEGILQKKLPNHIVDSCGTANYHIDESPDIRSIDVARENGIDISNHLGRQFSTNDFQFYDIIYVMDKANYSDVIQLAKSENEKQKVKLILSELPSSTIKEVADPYYGNIEDFRKCFSQLDEVCTVIANKLSN
ncbi:MAG: low molecular weight phosphotyrosine protein phosphatase [Flavobacteriales bacterium]|nr:low molecular weight phosphotyrosine protein phosphatase [Flavobacteriales bacterium]